MDIKTFDQCIEIANNTKGNKHLLLGNGFSVALFPQIFNYKKLAEQIDNDDIKQLFKEFDTSDFEFVMLKLIECLRVLDFYASGSDLYNKIEKDIITLKEILIKVIAQHHPESPQAITDLQYDSCFHFLNNFQNGKVYTFNYDLLLYWVFMHFVDSPDQKLKVDDGFRTYEDNESMVTWEIGRERNQNLYYIHGAMHLFRDKWSVIEKFNWRNTGVKISDQVRQAVYENKLPIFISEGTTEHKLKRITENGYLTRAMASLKSIGGSLFVFGHSIRDEDDHVFDLILKDSKVKNIFVSVFGDMTSAANEHIKHKIEKWNNLDTGKKFQLYDAQSAQVWDRF